MKLVEQWRAVERGLPEGWGDARLLLTVTDAGRAERAAALLGSAAPGRAGSAIRFSTARRGDGIGPEAVRRLLGRLDAERIGGALELVASSEPAAASHLAPARALLAEEWDAALATLPFDWSDVYGELDLGSTDHLARAALLLAPINPARFDGTPGFRFRCARRFGYGASPGMVRRCLGRVDEEGILGSVRILRALSDSRPAQTQGPVWYVGGKAV